MTDIQAQEQKTELATYVENVEGGSRSAIENVSGTGTDDQPVGHDHLHNLVYTNEEEEPSLHAKTYIALASIYLLLIGQGFVLVGPNSILAYIGQDLHGTKEQVWIANAPILVQAIVGPIVCLASDVFQARKPILIVACLITLVGCAIAPGSTSMARLIMAQMLSGVGIAVLPLSYVVPSEILPRKWRPMASASTGICTSATAIIGPLAIGAMTKQNRHLGWRHFYWLEFAVWATAAIGLFFGYRPPKRHTRLDHLSIWQKLGFLDIPGLLLLTIALTLFVYGLSVGGAIYPWSNVKTMAPLIIGLVFLGLFGVYEWKGTSTGVLNHALFQGGKNQGRTFVICNALIFIEGTLAIPFIVYYGLVSEFLFTQDPLVTAVRVIAFNGAFLLSCPCWGYLSVRLRSVREPLTAGFVFMTAGSIGMATLQPGQSATQLGVAAVAGVGFGCLLILIVAAAQLSVPHHLIATATAVNNSSRSVGALILGTAMGAALTNSLSTKVAAYITQAASISGFHDTNLTSTFVQAISTYNESTLSAIPGMTADIRSAGFAALKQAEADSVRLVYVISAPFGALAVFLCFWLGDMKKTMTFRVDAPMEDLTSKRQ